MSTFPRGRVFSGGLALQQKMAMKTLFSVGPGVFTDEEFAQAAGEISVPDLEGWEMFVESMGTTVYRKYKEVAIDLRSCACVCRLVFCNFQESGLYEYKILGVMDDLDPEMCAQVYVDWEYRKVWDTYVLGQ